VVRRARARRAPCKNAEEENSVAEVYLQLGADTVATRAVLHLLEQARRLGVVCKPPPPPPPPPRASGGCGIGCWNTPLRARQQPYLAYPKLASACSAHGSASGARA